MENVKPPKFHEIEHFLKTGDAQGHEHHVLIHHLAEPEHLQNLNESHIKDMIEQGAKKLRHENYMVKHEGSNLVDLAMKHPKFNESHINHILEKHPHNTNLIFHLSKNHFSKFNDAQVHHFLNSNYSYDTLKSSLHHFPEKFKKEHLEKIMSGVFEIRGHNSDIIQRDLLAHPEFDDSLLEKAFQKGSSQFRTNALTHGKLKEHHINHFIDNFDKYFVNGSEPVDPIFLYNNPHFKDQHFEKAWDKIQSLSDAKDYHLRSLSAHPKVSQKLADHIWDQNNDDFDSLKENVASKISKEKLDQIFDKHIPSNVKSSLVTNPNLTAEHIKKGLRDHGMNNLARHPNIGEDDINKIIDADSDNASRDTTVRAEFLLKNPNLKDEHLERLLKSPNPLIAKKAEQGLRARGSFEDPEQVEFALNTSKLRQARDLATQGQIHKKELEAQGLNPKDLKISHLQDAKGNIKAEDIQKHIDSLPKMKFGVSHSTYGTDHKEDVESLDDAISRHEDKFDPRDYEIFRSDERYLDRDKALKDHMSKFDPDLFVDRGDYPETDEGQTDYEFAVDEAKDQHLKRFDPNKYTGDDDFMDNDAYDSDVEDARERHMESFDPSHYGVGEESAYEDAESEQKHSLSPSQVFQMNVTKDQANQMKKEGVYDTFRDIMKTFSNSSHPVKENTIGWVRHTTGPDGNVHIDEIQSDFGQNFVKQIEGQAQAAKERGQITDAQARMAVARAAEEYAKAGPPEHFDKINQILFQGQHPNDLLHEAFLQHLRDTGKSGKKVHLWQAKPKAELSQMNVDKKLPIHMTHTYDKQPKKMGYKEAKYGDLDTQENPNLKGKSTWEMELRKKIDDKLNLLKTKIK